MRGFQFFTVGTTESVPDRIDENHVYLHQDSWDDFGYRSTFSLWIHDTDLARSRNVGLVKIVNTTADQPTMTRRVWTQLPHQFSKLDHEFVSLGQDRDLYTQLRSTLGLNRAQALLASINDLSLRHEDIGELAINSAAVAASLLRFISASVVEEQFARIMAGGATKESYWFDYALKEPDVPTMRFKVDPNTSIPTNLHVLIGANGVGKTTILNDIQRSMAAVKISGKEEERIDISDGTAMSNLVSIRFSAFDRPHPPREPQGSYEAFKYISIGLTNEADPDMADPSFAPGDDATLPNLTTTDGQRKFYSDSLAACLPVREERLLRATNILARADRTLSDYDIGTAEGLRQLPFDELSSGHKVALLSLVSLVLYCEERTLVLIDEPESHLHPPLLSAFTRALSELLKDRNGLAVVATHSPIILQEVPRECAWIVWAFGQRRVVSQPEIDTFGESVDVLTREVFGLEVREAGFYTILRSAADQFGSFRDALAFFDGKLGGDARLILRAMTQESQNRL